MTIEPAEHRILVVDDEIDLQSIFKRFLELEGFVCDVASSGEEALERLEEGVFSLMVTDINMPGMSGIELLRTSQENYPDLAVIMATGVDDRQVAVRALEMGAYAYVIKPVGRNELIINVVNGLRRRYLEMAHRRQQEELEALVRIRTRKLEEARRELAASGEETVLRLAKAAEFRDNETAQHTVRMSQYCALIARGLGLEKERCELIRLASQLHDVGKLGIPDAILLKPGRLTREEFSIMKEHAAFGYRILADSRAPVLRIGAIIARGHHEKFDGSGYPDGLKGEEIPLEARIAAVADVFDALTSRRVYKEAMPVFRAVEILRAERGQHFDPHLLDLFLGRMDEVNTIREQFKDLPDAVSGTLQKTSS